MAEPRDANDIPPNPRRTAESVGHAEAERTLLAAWNSGRMPHAWLIAGPPGIGKATLAFRTARFVLAGGGEGGLFGPPESLAIESSHPVFRRVASGGHADLLVVERPFTEDELKKPPEERDPHRRKASIGVDEVREAVSFLRLTPAEGGWRVVIVDAADDMTPNAANALLKTLEEPSSKALILLVSHAPGNLLPTIRSRTRRLSLKPLANDEIETLVAKHFPDMPGADRAALAEIAEGSIGRALALAGEGGVALDREIEALLAALPRGDGERLHRFAEQLSRAGADRAWQTATSLLAWRLARAIEEEARRRTTEDGRPIPHPSPGVGPLSSVLCRPDAPLDRWVEVWEKVTRLAAQSDGSAHARKQVVLGAFFALERAARG